MQHLRNNIDFEKVADLISSLYRTIRGVAPIATEGLQHRVVSKTRSEIDNKINTEDDYEQSIAKKNTSVG